MPGLLHLPQGRRWEQEEDGPREARAHSVWPLMLVQVSAPGTGRGCVGRFGGFRASQHGAGLGSAGDAAAKGLLLAPHSSITDVLLPNSRRVPYAEELGSVRPQKRQLPAVMMLLGGAGIISGCTRAVSGSEICWGTGEVLELPRADREALIFELFSTN